MFGKNKLYLNYLMIRGNVQSTLFEVFQNEKVILDEYLGKSDHQQDNHPKIATKNR